MVEFSNHLCVDYTVDETTAQVNPLMSSEAYMRQ